MHSSGLCIAAFLFPVADKCRIRGGVPLNGAAQSMNRNINTQLQFAQKYRTARRQAEKHLSSDHLVR